MPVVKAVAMHGGSHRGAVALPFGLHRPAVADGARQTIALDSARPYYFGELARSDAPPQIDLEQPVASCDVALTKEQIVDGLRVDVRHAPTVAQNLDGLAQTGQAHSLGL